MQVTETYCSNVDTSNNDISTPVNALIALLKNGDEAQRCYSARALHAQALSMVPELVKDTTRAVESVLNDNLYHEDPDVVIDSAMALARISFSDVSRLVEVAKLHPEADARLAALEALETHISHPNVEALFLDFAKGRGEGDNWGNNSDWDDWWDIQLKAVTSLANQPLAEHSVMPEYVATFKEILQLDPEPELESKLYQGIAKYDVNWIIERLSIANPASKRKLVKSLFFSNENMAKVFLYKQLRTDDAVNRKLAIEGLSKKEAREYFWDIVSGLQDNDFGVQKASALALKTFSLACEIDQNRLLNYIERSESTARPLLFELLSNSGHLDTDKIDKVLDLLTASNSESLLAITTHLLDSSISAEQTEQLLELFRKGMLSNGADTAILTALIRKGSTISGYDTALLSLFQDYIGRTDEQTLEYYYNASIRQATYDALACSEYPACKQLVRNALFGINAYADSIEVDIVEPEISASDTLVEQSEQAESDLELAALLDEYEERIDAPLNVVNTPSSTIGAIQQANIESELTADENEPEQQQRIIDMVEDLDSELGEYAQLVKDNFDSADNLELNRRKIAKLPMLSNKLIAIKSLGLSGTEEGAEWLIDSVLGAQPNELREIFQSLKRIKTVNPKSKTVDNGLGAAGNIVYHGDDLTKQSAINLLSVMPASKAIPLLLHSLDDENDHVRLCALVALDAHMPFVKLNQRDAVSIAINKCLTDRSSGVKKQALKMAALNRAKVDVSNNYLIDVAIDDEECHNIAVSVFSAEEYKEDTLMILANKLPTLKDHHQPNAIKLMGLLMA